MPSIYIPPRYRKKISNNNLELVANKALSAIGFTDNQKDYSITITGNDRIKNLNAQFRGINSPTDVLSFPSNETDPDTGKLFIGDIIISLPQAEEQALTSKHSLETEIIILVVHGLLHLLGYDHIEDDKKKVMWELQSKILSSFGIDIHIP